MYLSQPGRSFHYHNWVLSREYHGIAAVLCNKCVTVAITNKHFILTPNATPVGFLPQRFPSSLNGIPYDVVRLTQKPNGYLSLRADPPPLSYAHIVHPHNLDTPTLDTT